MQNEITTRKYIKKVLEDLAQLNGSEFEQLSYYISSHYVKRYIQGRGLTLEGHPVGYTLDAYSDDLKECIECSVEKDYFRDFSKPNTGTGTKVAGDIDHIFDRVKNPECVILFSNQVCTQSQGMNLGNYINRIEKDKHVEISWFDGQKISEYIIKDCLQDNLFIQKIQDYLPVLGEIQMLLTNNARMPVLPDNYAVHDNLEALKKQLYRNRCLYIYGISGIGKSMLAIELAEAIQSEFDTLYYVDGTKINSSADLEAVELFGTTGKINIVGNIKRSGTLLIIDDLKADYDRVADELLECCNSGSCVILTSQTDINNKGICYKMNFPTEEQSRIILEYQTVSCPKKVIEIIKEKTNYHPLLLTLINQMAQEEQNWTFVEDELKHCPDFETDSGVRVCEHLLRHYLPVLQNEFEVINWLDCQYMNKDLLKKMVGNSGLRKLKRRALIYEASAHSLKVHDIIFSCIKEVTEGRKQYQEEFLEFFGQYIGNKNASYHQAIHLHQEKILKIIEQEKKPGIALYLYLNIWPNDAHGIVSEIKMDTYMAETYEYRDEDLYALYSVVQLIECLYRKYKGSWEERKTYAKTQIGSLLKLMHIKNAPDEFITYVKHHLGKLYVYIGDDTAISIFRELLEKQPEKYEAKLQLGKLYRKDKDKRGQGERLLCEIIDAYAEGKEPGMTLVLAAYEEIKNTKDEKLKQTYFVDKYDDFASAVQTMALEKFDQPYRVLAGASRIYTYNHPEYLQKLVESIPFPSVREIDRKYAFTIAETYKEYGKSLLWETPGAEDNLKAAKVYFEQAEVFYNACGNGKIPYNLISHAENLNKLGQYEKAAELLRDDTRFTDERNKPFREYRYAEALYGLGAEQYKEALVHINNALASENIDKYRSAFEEQKAKILYGIDPFQEDWKKVYEQAIAIADDKYRKALQARYEKLCNDVKKECL